MKAKDYFAKYEQDVMSCSKDAWIPAVSNMIKDMNHEVEDLIKVRHVKTDAGFLPIMKEMNKKWNAVVRLFEKKYGISPIAKDGFRLYWINQNSKFMNKI